MRHALLSSLLASGIAFTTPGIAAAADEGYFTVSYREISFNLTQLGGYGELVIEPMGFKGLGFGSCTLNFTRDAEGRIQDRAPVVTSNAASCPDTLDYTLSPGKSGFVNLTFTNAGALTGETFELFPALVPLRDDLRITAPKGFDILGLTIGQTRTEIEATLTQKGFTRMEGYENVTSYQGGLTKATSAWGKGTYEHDADQPADIIGVSWTALIEGESQEEKAEYITRNWRIPPSENLSAGNLRRSLEEKHGKTTSGFEDRIYDRSGTFFPKAFKPACANNVHLQNVSTSYALIGMVGEVMLSPACGAEVKMMVGEDYSANGRADYLRISLLKGDVAYESFWTTWSRGEVKALQERYELQNSMLGSTPDL